MNIQWRVGVRPLEVSVRDSPLLVQADLTSWGDHKAYHVEGTGQPIQVATRRTWELWDDLDSAAYRGAACRESTAAGGGRLGSWPRRLMDSVVAPYLRLLALERLVGMNVECIPERTLSGLRRD